MQVQSNSAVLIGNVFNGTTGSGSAQNGTGLELNVGIGTVWLQNNIAYGNAAWGIGNNAPANILNIFTVGNAYGSNTSGNLGAGIPASASDVTLTANPWVSPAGGNFALNSTAGGGAALKGVGFPGVSLFGTGYIDIGPLQSCRRRRAAAYSSIPAQAEASETNGKTIAGRGYRTSKLLLQVFIQDTTSTSGAGLTGLVYNASGLAAYYYREGASASVAISLATQTLGTWGTGGFIVVDATNMPGVYQLGIPNLALASGAKSVIVESSKGGRKHGPGAHRDRTYRSRQPERQ